MCTPHLSPCARSLHFVVCFFLLSFFRGCFCLPLCLFGVRFTSDNLVGEGGSRGKEGGMAVATSLWTWTAASTAVVASSSSACTRTPLQLSPRLLPSSGQGVVLFPALRLKPCSRSSASPGRWWGVRAQAFATTEPAVSEPIKLVDAPVSIVTGSSRGIGKAIALALGGAGGKVRSERGVSLFCHVLF